MFLCFLSVGGKLQQGKTVLFRYMYVYISHSGICFVGLFQALASIAYFSTTRHLPLLLHLIAYYASSCYQAFASPTYLHTHFAQCIHNKSLPPSPISCEATSTLPAMGLSNIAIPQLEADQTHIECRLKWGVHTSFFISGSPSVVGFLLITKRALHTVTSFCRPPSPCESSGNGQDTVLVRSAGQLLQVMLNSWPSMRTSASKPSGVVYSLD